MAGMAFLLMRRRKK
ncbi:MAG: hypothetical protein ACLSCR_13690 [Akkermansia sp.]